jgi:hypothetical protein
MTRNIAGWLILEDKMYHMKEPKGRHHLDGDLMGVDPLLILYSRRPSALKHVSCWTK